MHLFGSVGGAIFFQNTINHEALTIKNVGTLVIAHGYEGNNGLQNNTDKLGAGVISIGDALQPCSVEEAVLDGLKAGVSI